MLLLSNCHSFFLFLFWVCHINGLVVERHMEKEWGGGGGPKRNSLRHLSSKLFLANSIFLRPFCPRCLIIFTVLSLCEEEDHTFFGWQKKDTLYICGYYKEDQNDMTAWMTIKMTTLVTKFWWKWFCNYV